MSNRSLWHLGFASALLGACVQPDDERLGSTTLEEVQPDPCIYSWNCGQSFQLLIVTSPSLRAEADRLAAHKRSTGLTAFVTTIDAIRSAFPGARDDAEVVKRAIAYAHQYLGTRYVMLAGDGAHVPIRHRFVRQPPGEPNNCRWLDGTYNPADLYFANLYRDHTSTGAHGYVFDDWDRNGDMKFNDSLWSSDPMSPVTYNPDGVDGYPDIAVGRVPAHSAVELGAYVDKVIAYESRPWFPGAGHHTFFIDRQYDSDSNPRTAPYDLISQIEAPIAAPTNDHIGLGYADPAGIAPLAPYWRGAKETVSAAAGQSDWLIYLGHGSTQAWGASLWSVADARAMSNAYNTPIVLAASCDTGQFARNAPFGRYLGQDGRTHNFVAPNCQNGLPVTVDDSDQGTSMATPITVPPPSVYETAPGGVDVSADFTARGWLTAPKGGAIAYFGETIVHLPAPSARLAKEITAAYGTASRLGDAYLSGQRAYWSKYRNQGGILDEPRLYLGVMTMFGDPSLSLRPNRRNDVTQNAGFCKNPGQQLHVGDFNADGVSDLLCQDMNNGHQSTSLTASTTSSTTLNATRYELDNYWCYGSEAVLKVGDFDGDHHDDLLCHHKTNGHKWIMWGKWNGYFVGTGWESAMGFCGGSNRQLEIADFNRDGRDDMLCHNTLDGSKEIVYAERDGTFANNRWSSAMGFCWGSEGQLLVGDVDGDQRADLVCHHKGDGRKWIAYADNFGHFTGVDWSANLGWCWGNANLEIADMNGDGRADLVCNDRASGQKWIAYADVLGHYTGTNWQRNTGFCYGTAYQQLVGRFAFGSAGNDFLCSQRTDGQLWLKFAPFSP